MTTKVNGLVRFINMFSDSGVVANEQIKLLKKNSNAPIYQRRYLNGTIALLQDTTRKALNDDVFCLIKPDGSMVTKATSNQYIGNGYKLHTCEKTSNSDFSNKAIGFVKEVFYNLNSKDSNHQIEEYAKKSRRTTLSGESYYDDWVSRLFVFTKKRRESEFPSTKLGGSIHPAIANKFERENGDIIYIEKYPSL